jgi:hypothetical protein
LELSFTIVTVNGARYTKNILHPFFAKLTKEEKLYGVFQHMQFGSIVGGLQCPVCGPDAPLI